MTARAFAAAGLIGCARAALATLQSPYLSDPEDASLDLAALAFARVFLESLPWALAGALAGLPEIDVPARSDSALKGLAKTAARTLFPLTLFVLGIAFAAGRLPSLGTRATWMHGADGLAAHLALAVVVGAALVLLARGPWTRRMAPVLASFCLVLVAASGLAAFTEHSERASWPARPNAILISLDTTRAGVLGCYGYDRPTTPELDRFAREAVRFENAFTPFPWTLPAHATLLTSLVPRAHGAAKSRSIAPEAPTIAKALARVGYRTAALVDTIEWVSPRFGLAAGFDTYQRVPYSAAHKNAHLLPLLDDLGNGPFFLFLHYFDAHADPGTEPYEAHAEDRELLALEPGEAFAAFDPDVGTAPAILRAMNARGEVPDPRDRAYLRSMYDAGVRTLDRVLGELFRELDERGLLETSIIIVTADHGEAFYEHGKALHVGLFDETVHVPLLVRTPATPATLATSGREPVREVVGLIDVAPTVLDFCGVPQGWMQGTSLRPLLEASGAWEGPGHVLLDDGEKRSGLRTREWKLLIEPDGTRRLYDLTHDPAELSDASGRAALADVMKRLQELHDAELERAALLRARIAGGDAGSAGVDLAGEELSALEALGYTGDE